MSWPYTWHFAVLCLAQGGLVAMGRRDDRRLIRLRVAGLLIPVVALCTGILLIVGGEASRTALARLATFGTPVAAALVGVVAVWRRPIISIVLAPVLFVIAWRADGLVQDAAAVALIGLATVALAAVIAAVTTARALAAGLVILAIVDSFLVFRGHLTQPTAELHAVAAPHAGGVPLPSLQDATFGGSLMGWLDFLAPACAGMLFVDDDRERRFAAILTAVTSLTWGLLLAVTSPIPGTVPPLAAVLVWLICSDAPPSARHREPFNPLLAQRRRGF